MMSHISSLPLLISQVIAMGPPPQPGDNPARSMVATIVPVILMIAVMYLVMIRPQQKQQKVLQQQLDALKVGDRVLTTGGIFGIVSQLKDKSVVVKIAENTKVEMLRSGIQKVLLDEAKE